MLRWEERHKYLDGAVPQRTADSRLVKHVGILPGPTVLSTVKQKEWAPMQCEEATESLLLGTDRTSLCRIVTDT